MIRFLTKIGNIGISKSNNNLPHIEILHKTQLPRVIKHFKKTHFHSDISILFARINDLDQNHNHMLKIIDKTIRECNFPILFANNLKTFTEIYKYYQDKIRIIWIDDECLELLSLKKIRIDDIPKLIIISTFLAVMSEEDEALDGLEEIVYQILNHEFYNDCKVLGNQKPH